MSDTGGPAFPTENHAKTEQYGSFGMTLRDYFAAKAMQGLIMRQDFTGSPKQYAEKAYETADVMLKVRDE